MVAPGRIKWLRRVKKGKRYDDRAFALNVAVVDVMSSPHCSKIKKRATALLIT